MGVRVTKVTFDQSPVQRMNALIGPKPEIHPGRGQQHVLKAEAGASRPDATDRDSRPLSNVDRVLSTLSDIRGAARFVGLE